MLAQGFAGRTRASWQKSSATMLRLIFFSAFFTVSAIQETPVQKVARLLTGMKDQLGADAKSDEELYEKMGCFCAPNKKDKPDAVDMAEKNIVSLKGKIEELTAKSAELSSAITRLGGEIAKAEGALSQATSIREKENGEFSDSEKELMESLASCTAAIETLSGLSVARSFRSSKGRWATRATTPGLATSSASL